MRPGQAADVARAGLRFGQAAGAFTGLIQVPVNGRPWPDSDPLPTATMDLAARSPHPGLGQPIV
jgi:hypothetical protein